MVVNIHVHLKRSICGMPAIWTPAYDQVISWWSRCRSNSFLAVDREKTLARLLEPMRLPWFQTCGCLLHDQSFDREGGRGRIRLGGRVLW